MQAQWNLTPRRKAGERGKTWGWERDEGNSIGLPRRTWEKKVLGWKERRKKEGRKLEERDTDGSDSS